MKKSTIITLLVITLLVALIINSCERKIEEADKGLDDFDMGKVFNSLTIYDNIGISVIHQDSTNNVEHLITEILDDLGLSYNSSDTHFGLALLYDNVIDTTSYNNLKAVVHYYTDTKNYSKVWIKNSTSFDLEDDFSKQTQSISNEDLYRFIIAKGLNTQNVLLLIDQTELPADQYYTEFQTVIDKEFKSVVDPTSVNDAGSRKCASGNSCSMATENGTCTAKEYANGGVGNECEASVDNKDCSVTDASPMLISNSTPLDSSVIPDLHYVRDNVLLHDSKLEFLIDDFYYVSKVISSNLTLSIALDIYNLSNTNFINILKN